MMDICAGLSSTITKIDLQCKVSLLSSSSSQQLDVETTGRMQDYKPFNPVRGMSLCTQIVRRGSFANDRFIALNGIDADNVGLAMANTMIQLPGSVVISKNGQVSADVPCLYISRRPYTAEQYVNICKHLVTIWTFASSRSCSYPGSSTTDVLQQAIFFQHLFNDSLTTVKSYSELRNGLGLYTSVCMYTGDTASSCRAIYTFLWEVLQHLLGECPEESTGWYIVNTSLDEVLASNLQYNNSRSPVLGSWTTAFADGWSWNNGPSSWKDWNMQSFFYNTIVLPLRSNYNPHLPGWSMLLLPLAVRNLQKLTFVVSVLRYEANDPDDDEGAREKLVLCHIRVNFTTSGLGYTLTMMDDMQQVYEITSFVHMSLVQITSTMNVGGLFDQNGLLLPTFGSGTNYVSTILQTLRADPAYKAYMRTPDIKLLNASNGVRSWPGISKGTVGVTYVSPSYFGVDDGVNLTYYEYGAYCNNISISGVSGVGTSRALTPCYVYLLNIGGRQCIVVSPDAAQYTVGSGTGFTVGQFSIGSTMSFGSTTLTGRKQRNVIFAVATSTQAYTAWVFNDCDIYNTTLTGGNVLSTSTSNEPGPFQSAMYVLDSSLTLYTMSSNTAIQIPFVAQLVYGQGNLATYYNLTMRNYQSLAGLDIRSWLARPTGFVE